jgi:hypothetical protein
MGDQPAPEPLRCHRCGLVCQYKFSSVEFFYQAEEKSLIAELRGEDLGYCRPCNTSLREALYVLWEYLKKSPKHADLPKLWSVGFVRWTNGRICVVWG